MSDENTSEETKPAGEVEGQEPEETDEEQGETTSEETPDNEQAEEADDETDAEDEDDSDLTVSDYRSIVKQLRSENAKHRKSKKELVQKLESAKTDDDIAKAVNEAKAETRQLLVENVALKHNLPGELAEVLKGDTRDELEEHAKRLSKFVQTSSGSDPNLEGGLDPTSDADSSNVADAVKRARRRR